ncbi:MAG TPA: carcinine hydrolase/isopenicillin-N N-acyltransferase family protein [Acidimicrobiales bacterium]|nr:carcinine hydrolase/isopenicillin-N N-acyltransferase family protein [Acidimicrobiales bacterium]
MCDCLVALSRATADGSTLFAKNSDRPPTECQVVERFAPRTELSTRTTYLEIESPDHETIGFVGSRPEWMWGVEHGVNAAGVAIGNATIYTTLDPRGTPEGLTGMDLVRLALERCHTAASAVEVIGVLLERHGQGGSGHAGADRPYWSSFLIADPRTAFVMETSGSEFEVEQVSRTRATSNRTTIPSFDATHRHPRQPVERLVDGRLSASREVLEDEPVRVEGLMRHLRSHAGGEDGYTVCMHVPDVEATMGSMVAELPVNRAPRAWFLTGSPCENEYARLDP